jgi:hypothetical protein
MTESDSGTQDLLGIDSTVTVDYINSLTRHIEEKAALRTEYLAKLRSHFGNGRRTNSVLIDLALYCLATDTTLAQTMKTSTFDSLMLHLDRIMRRLDACRGQAVVMVEVFQRQEVHCPDSCNDCSIVIFSDEERIFRARAGILPLSGQLIFISPMNTGEMNYLDIRAHAPTPLRIDIRSIGALAESKIPNLEPHFPIWLAFPKTPAVQLCIGDAAIAFLKNQPYGDSNEIDRAIWLAREELPDEKELSSDEAAIAEPPAHQIGE